MKSNKIFGSDNESNKILASLSDRIALIEKQYNPERLNLHFESPPKIEFSIFEELLPIGQEAWIIIQNQLSRETLYWFYRYFLLIANASFTAQKSKSDHPIPIDVIKNCSSSCGYQANDNKG